MERLDAAVCVDVRFDVLGDPLRRLVLAVALDDRDEHRASADNVVPVEDLALVCVDRPPQSATFTHFASLL